jgi:hypothetical protein
LITLLRIRRQPGFIDVNLFQHKVMMQAVLAGDINLLGDTAICSSPPESRQ